MYFKMLLQICLIGEALSCLNLSAAELLSCNPAHDSKDVETTTSFNLIFSDPLEPETLSNIKLIKVVGDQSKDVPTRNSTDLTNASITVVPTEFLELNQDYAIKGSRHLLTKTGRPVDPFRLEFRTTGKVEDLQRSHFTAETFDKTRSMTTVLFGPDRRLYAASAFGEIVCWNVDLKGRSSHRQTLFRDETTSRQFIDLEWDPAATRDNLILWVSYSERLTPNSNPRHFFTGAIARLTIKDAAIIKNEVVVKGLPHGRERQGGFETLPHQPNGLCFRDGKLYQSVGSTSSSGGPPNWGIVEQPFSACILEIDYQKIEQPVDLMRNGNPRFVRRYATGVRNALELLAHSNGRLYTAVNINDRRNRSDGVPDDPEIPGDQNALIENVTPDHESLLIIEEGRHYGFPNPSIGNYVLNGGNPTRHEDPYEIDDYPVGINPEPGFAPELMFPIWKWGGTSPNGMIEYLPDFEHPLKHALLCCFYSANDIAWMPLGNDGLPEAVKKLRSPKGKLKFAGPLDITQDRQTGSLYVSDFGKQSLFGKDGSMIWLRVARSSE